MEMDDNKDNQNSSLSPALGNFLAFLFLFKSHLDIPYKFLPAEEMLTVEQKAILTTREIEMKRRKANASFITD
jgi:hypothetical protein